MCRILRLPDPPTIRNIKNWRADPCPIIDITDSPNCLWVPFWKWDKQKTIHQIVDEVSEWPVF